MEQVLRPYQMPRNRREQLVKPCDFTSVVYDLDDCGVVTLTINRPEIRNALTLRVLLELFWAADAVAQDPAANAVIITGESMKSRSRTSSLRQHI